VLLNKVYVSKEGKYSKRIIYLLKIKKVMEKESGQKINLARKKNF